MFDELKAVVEVIRTAVSGLHGFRSRKARTDAILELLSIYFILMDVVEDGRALLDAAGPDPKKKLANLPRTEVPRVLAVWDRVIRRQASRLYDLSGRVLGQDALAVIDPVLRTRLETLVGSKLDRTQNLEGVGARLVMYSMFGAAMDQDWQQGMLLSMYPKRTSTTLNVEAAHKELQQLQEALEAFRRVCLQLASQEEILLLSRKARSQTRWSDD